jgi:hypothetical protein
MDNEDVFISKIGFIKSQKFAYRENYYAYIFIFYLLEGVR